MELRRAPPRGPGHRCPGGDGGGADRLSGLPDDLLLHVLARLRCARAAAHTSLLSRRWRGLWTHLPELSFREISPGALDAALAQVARAELSLLDIDVPERHQLSPARVGSLLRTAARLAPADLRLVVWGLFQDRATAVEVPCFHRAASVKLGVWNLVLTLPEQGGGAFPVVERLSIDGFGISFGALVPRCPRLRQLEARHSDRIGTITVHSPTIESLDVDGVVLSGIDIVAPRLKKFTLRGSYTRTDLRVVSFSAPMVRNVHWSAHFFPWWALIGGKWALRSFSFHLEESGYLLDLEVEAQDFWRTEDVNLMQNIAQFPYFSVLELFLRTWGHIYGATVFNVLEVCTDIKKLRLIIRELELKPCPEDCPCDQPYNWRSRSIPLVALEEVEIEGFKGAGHEVDLLKLIIKCAPMLKSMTVTLTDEASPCLSGCKETYRVLKACPSLKWSFKSRCGVKFRMVNA